MLCFLAPLPAAPQGGPQPARPQRAPTIAGPVLVTLLALCALLAPIGWAARPQGPLATLAAAGGAGPETAYTVRVGAPTRVGPLPIAREMVAGLAQGGSQGPSAFFAGALPPGLTLDPATGALVGVPTVAGVYTVALGLMDGSGRTATARPFKVTVFRP